MSPTKFYEKHLLPPSPTNVGAHRSCWVASPRAGRFLRRLATCRPTAVSVASPRAGRFLRRLATCRPTAVSVASPPAARLLPLLSPLLFVRNRSSRGKGSPFLQSSRFAGSGSGAAPCPLNRSIHCPCSSWELGAWKPLGISGRQRARLRKEVLLAGEDWTYDPPRSKMCTKRKGHKVDRVAAEKRANTLKLVRKMPQMLLDYKVSSSPPPLLVSVSCLLANILKIQHLPCILQRSMSGIVSKSLDELVCVITYRLETTNKKANFNLL